MVWCRFLFIHWLIVFARSELQSENHEGTTSTASAFCSAECNQQIQNRLETIESAVRTIVSALLSTQNDVLSSVRDTLLQNPSIASMVPALSSTIFSSTRSENTSFFESGSPGKQVIGGHQQEHNKTVENLKGVVKCSLIAYLDVDMIDYDSYVNQSTHITASMANDSLEITWPLYSAACLKFSSGVWIRVYQQSTENDYKLQPETSLYVPQKCLKKNFETSYSITLLPPSSNEKKNSCAFSLARNLIQCRAYVIEVIPNFQSLRGSKTLRKEIVVPPKRINEPSMKPLISVVAHSNSLMLNWEDNSGCAPQLTSFKLTIFPDGIVEDEGTNMTITIPRICLKQSQNEDNLFSLVLPNNKLTSACPIEWKPLDRCRKYRLDMVSLYSVIWSGPSSSLDIFTVQQEETVNYSTHSVDVIWNCPRQHYYCKQKRSRSSCVHIKYHICDGIDHCSDGKDEKYCDLNVCNNGGWRCGRQCIPKELVCDGKYDCLDASDEVNCSHVNTCVQLTNPSGNFISRPFPKPAVDIHQERLPDAIRMSSVLITVQPNHQIWLTFGKFVTFENQNFLKIYDGPFSTSPLLFSHSGSVQPSYSVRSSSNDLFVEFPSYYDTNMGIEAFYASVKKINGTDEPFVPGCGGYIYGEGIISTPNYLSSSGIVECFWFVETRQSEDTILMRNNFSDIKLTAFLSRAHPAIIVYDGWDMSGRVIYDGKSFHVRNKTIIYSISNKILVHFKPPKVKDGHVFNWNVSKISTPQCKNHLEGSTGTLKSPNYPMLYPHLTDCRWTITP